jgi:hypothetical protein
VLSPIFKDRYGITIGHLNPLADDHIIGGGIGADMNGKYKGNYDDREDMGLGRHGQFRTDQAVRTGSKIGQ